MKGEWKMKITVELNLTKEIFRKAVLLYVDDWNHVPEDLTKEEAVNAIIAVYFNNYEEQFWKQVIKTFSSQDIHNMCEGFAAEYCLYLKETICSNLGLELSDIPCTSL